jgi:two-component system, cell cycle response regulator
MACCEVDDEEARLETLHRYEILDTKPEEAFERLTGAMTRRPFYERARLDVERARRYFKPLSCAVIDIDNFKLVSDTHGHASGDRLVQHLVSICKSGLRASDYLGRIGGDEFAMMLPDTSVVDAFDVADCLRKGLAAALEVSSMPMPLTVSIGIAEYIQPEASLEELLHGADAALYDAKSKGKNRVVCYLDDLRIAPDDPSQAPSRVGYSYRDAPRKQAS